MAMLVAEVAAGARHGPLGRRLSTAEAALVDIPRLGQRTRCGSPSAAVVRTAAIERTDGRLARCPDRFQTGRAAEVASELKGPERTAEELAQVLGAHRRPFGTRRTSRLRSPSWSQRYQR